MKASLSLFPLREAGGEERGRSAAAFPGAASSTLGTEHHTPVYLHIQDDFGTFSFPVPEEVQLFPFVRDHISFNIFSSQLKDSEQTLVMFVWFLLMSNLIFIHCFTDEDLNRVKMGFDPCGASGLGTDPCPSSAH